MIAELLVKDSRRHKSNDDYQNNHIGLYIHGHGFPRIVRLIISRDFQLSVLLFYKLLLLRRFPVLFRRFLLIIGIDVINIVHLFFRYPNHNIRQKFWLHGIHIRCKIQNIPVSLYFFPVFTVRNLSLILLPEPLIVSHRIGDPFCRQFPFPLILVCRKLPPGGYFTNPVKTYPVSIRVTHTFGRKKTISHGDQKHYNQNQLIDRL